MWKKGRRMKIRKKKTACLPDVKDHIKEVITDVRKWLEDQEWDDGIFYDIDEVCHLVESEFGLLECDYPGCKRVARTEIYPHNDVFCHAWYYHCGWHFIVKLLKMSLGIGEKFFWCKA